MLQVINNYLMHSFIPYSTQKSFNLSLNYLSSGLDARKPLYDAQELSQLLSVDLVARVDAELAL